MNKANVGYFLLNKQKKCKDTTKMLITLSLEAQQDFSSFAGFDQCQGYFGPANWLKCMSARKQSY